MLKPPVPENEERRLASLYEFNILDTLSERDYDDVTHLASAICKTPIASITFIDKDRQWFKSHKGLHVNETKREYAFCAHAISSPDEILVVEDLRKDVRFADNPFVTGDPHVAFYTGVPLVTTLGDSIGTLCVVDNIPRTLSEEQISALKILSNQVMNLLQLRKQNADMKKIQEELMIRNDELEQFASVLSHDIKSPLAGILLSGDLLSAQFKDDPSSRGSKLVSGIKRSANAIVSLVDGILEYYKNHDIKSNRQTIYLPDFFEALIPMLGYSKALNISYPKEHSIFFNRTLLQQIFFNIIGNSIRYNDKSIVEVSISFSEDAHFYFFTVKDNGIGIAAEDQTKIFALFTSLSNKQRPASGGYGIGLATVKKIIEKNGGQITVQSVKGEGTTFSFRVRKDYGAV